MISSGAITSQSTQSDRRPKAFRDRTGGTILIMTAIALTVFSAMTRVAIDGVNKPVMPGISIDDILIDTVGPDGSEMPGRIEVRRLSYEAASFVESPTCFRIRA